MALHLTHPIALKNGVYRVNVRVLVDLASRVEGSTVTLPLGTQSVRIRASDKVIMSLRTKDAALAKARGQRLVSLTGAAIF